MKKNSLLLLLLLGALFANSQDTLTSYDQGLVRELKINLQDYKVFSQGIKEFEQRMLRLHRSRDMSLNEKKQAIEKLRKEREDFIVARLNAEQQQVFKTYQKNKSTGLRSEAAQRREQQMQRLKQSAVKQNGS